MMTIATFNAWSSTLTAVGLAVLWQSVVLAGLIALACRLLLTRSSPALRYWCWQIVAFKLLVMPWWILAVPVPPFLDPAPSATTNTSPSAVDTSPLPRSKVGMADDADETGHANAPAAEAPSSSTVFAELSWQTWLVLAWLGGVCWQIVSILLLRRRVQRLLGRTVPTSDPRLLRLVDELSGRLGLRRGPPVLLTSEAISPLVCGVFRAVLVLPAGLLTSIDETACRQVLLHELAHVKRRDLLWGWLPEIARMIYFFNPVAHWLCSRIRLERELACDQVAMAHSGKDAGDYALTLVQVVAHSSMPAALQTVAALAPANQSGEPGLEAQRRHA
jgi:beta-lactamase regulating signal transducer with metallopeptidase domain